MSAAVLEAPGRLVITERPVPRIGRDDDVLLEVEACGICGTDLHILATPPGHPSAPGVVLGHELVGIVRETGSDAADLVRGGRVAVAPNIACGHCRWCRRGLPNHCERFSTVGIFRDGGLAGHVVVPASACHPVSGELPAFVAALAEPLSCVMNGIQQARLLPGEDVVILGAGPVGLMFTALFRAAGAGRIVVVEPTPPRAEVAARMGADEVVGPGDAVPLHDGADVVVDAVGSQFPAALAVVRRGGRILLFGMDARARAEIAQVDITRNELTVFGTYVGVDTFPAAVDVLERRVVDLSPMITHVVGLAELPEAVDALRAGTAVKVVVDLRR
ncbi:MAG: alcohol dehydrogenase catalytic domain-containing protein [Actinomycetota bacterium]